jgi:UDP-2-acetamido-3-amino-2,3-dideoxy-glucuronate N-acetyltransferase
MLEQLSKNGASIGAGSIIKSHIEIGEYALIGAGSLLTKSVGAFELWYGSPAMHKGYVTREGKVLSLELKDEDGHIYEIVNNEPVKK